jgi:uncharacterized protein
MARGETSRPKETARAGRRVALPVLPAEPLPAGRFSEWLSATRSAREERRDVGVPCGECNACCRSSLFIHIGPEEADTLAHIAPELLFPAPGLPAGHVLLGYDKKGRCPMLKARGCSIYEHRPRTCRDFDCRTVAATGMALDGAQQAIAEQARRWRFEHAAPEDDGQQAAVRAAAAFLVERGPELLPGSLPGHPLQLALLAVRVYEVFHELSGGARTAQTSDADLARAILTAMTRGEKSAPSARATSVKRGARTPT